uniref:Uncharacterized protein n=1 Tax=Arundo donax TaxID=35708 RepID=A0A0A9AAY3_ARUDO
MSSPGMVILARITSARARTMPSWSASKTLDAALV